MKKIALFILAVVALCSCSKDETVTNQPTDGQYIAETTDMVLCMVIENEKCTYFASFIQNVVVDSWNNVSTSGEYPNYVYRIEDLTITANFESSTAFAATLNGYMGNAGFSPDNFIAGGTQAVFENVPVYFKLDNRTLDANGDGILDSAQPDLFSE